ncbi:type VI secretion system-associated protein TagO [Saccharospirillum salsuginis]|uniref:Uncharacterized protein n=1 Tax=Saccharospirillum salsuginis TaxID=418750 RepID=A0A918NAB9_9GAMM|nr:type VI secretion system-associated protein TagO [Saccharospirillum salsuginis]GGX52832.1 hypothetical protein GCM10007392_20320 [Saccharospirillum salsuginis]
MKTTLSVFAGLTFSATSAWADFRVDLEPAEVAGKLDIWTIANLSVGESGLVQANHLEYCEDRGRVLVSSITELSGDFPDDSAVLKILREPGGTVSIGRSQQGRELTAADFVAWSYDMSHLPQCSHLHSDGVPTLRVNRFFGSTSLSELTGWLVPDGSGPSYPDTGPGDPVGYNWQLSETQSPILGTTRIILSTRSISDEATLMIRCQRNQMDVYIATENTVDHSRQPVTMRLGDAMTETVWMTPSTDNDALFFDDAIAIIERMFHANDALFRFHDTTGASKTELFRIEGLEQAIEPFREACDW